MANPIIVKGTENGLRVDSEYHRAKLKEMIANGTQWFELRPRVRESRKQRGYYHGAICGMFAYFHEGLDHTKAADLEKVHEWLKIEHNGEFVVMNGKSHKVGKSTKKQLNEGFLERCIDDLVQNYGLDEQLLDPAKYCRWRDEIYPHGGPKNYIAYLESLNLL